MKIETKEIEKLTYTLSVEIARQEADQKKNDSLRKHRKTAEIKGFRKGMAPIGLIEKMYGESAFMEAVNTILSDGINGYIKDNKLDMIGEPMPNQELQPKLDWQKDEKLTFVYTYALKPKVDLKLDKNDKVTSEKLKVTPDKYKQYKEDTLKQFGSLVDVETATDEDFIVADFKQDEKTVENTYISLKNLDAKAKKLLSGKKKGDSFEIDVVKNFPNEVDRAAMLKVKKEEFDSSKPLYLLTVKEVKSFKPASENQDLYDRLFGKDVVKTAEEFDKKLHEKLSEEYKLQDSFRLRKDIVDYLVKKADLQLPEGFLKKWLFYINEGKFTMEQIEKEFPLFLEDYKWQLVAHSIYEQQKMSIKQDDLLEAAKKLASTQFAMYGMVNIPDEQLTQYASEMVKNEKEINRVYEKCEEDKVLDYVKKTITIE